MKKSTLLLPIIGLILTTGCDTHKPNQLKASAPTTQDLREQQSVVMTRPELTTFASLIRAADLLDFFYGTGPFTSFVPSNEAFEKFGMDKVEKLKDPAKKDELVDFINYHIILGKYLSQNMKTGKVRTLNGKDITIRTENGHIFVNDAMVITPDLVGPNGVSYIINQVLS
ncbi:MAG: fasciclin domain-containing protein [Chlamydiales bacterium]|nr:fasciclin domain-containing protein [Chlamydiales bacterium]